MRIHADFIGGNIMIQSENENMYFLERDLRDTQEDWFYWAFCAEGAQGRTITFQFQKDRIGYWGPAVSHDLRNWSWLGAAKDGNTFTYTFAPEEDKVYFAHHMLYHPERFEKFAKGCGLEIGELCKSRKGRSVPFVSFGQEGKNIVLTARHHACESTGSYVLEGVLESLCKNPIAGTRIFCVPFVDYDGVTDGDQGKFRTPHDHYIDYPLDKNSIYPETDKICRFADSEGVYLGFDFHSPWHCRGRNDKAFIAHESIEKADRLYSFGKLLEECITENAFQYASENDIAANVEWNVFGISSCPGYMLANMKNDIAFPFEMPYFGEKGNAVSQSNMVETGRCFADALRKYIAGSSSKAPHLD